MRIIKNRSRKFLCQIPLIFLRRSCLFEDNAVLRKWSKRFRRIIIIRSFHRSNKKNKYQQKFQVYFVLTIKIIGLSIQLFLTFSARVPMLSSWVLHRTHTIHLPVYIIMFAFGVFPLLLSLFWCYILFCCTLSLTNLELMQWRRARSSLSATCPHHLQQGLLKGLPHEIDFKKMTKIYRPRPYARSVAGF